MPLKACGESTYTYTCVFAPKVLHLCKANYRFKLLLKRVWEPLVSAVQQSQGCLCSCKMGLLSWCLWSFLVRGVWVWMQAVLLTLCCSAHHGPAWSLNSHSSCIFFCSSWTFFCFSYSYGFLEDFPSLFSPAFHACVFLLCNTKCQGQQCEKLKLE